MIQNDSTRPLCALIWSAVSSEAQATDDKDSLDSQDREARAKCDLEGWQIIDMLRIPGHTRRIRDFHVLRAVARRKGILAFDRLYEHWQENDFDVLICRDDNRFARSQAVHAFIVEETIERGARIYTMLNGWIDKSNYRGRIALGGYKAAGEIDTKIVELRNGRNKKVERGLPYTRVPFPYLIVRDPVTGERAEAIVDERHRPLLDDLAKLVLEGIGYERLNYEIAKLGHLRPDGGGPFATNYFRTRLLGPFWWGNTAVGPHKAGYDGHWGLWAFDPTEPPPPGIIVYWGNHQSVYTGQVADDIKAELRRRTENGVGKFSPSDPHAFSMILICGECWRTMSAHKMRSGDYGWACFNRFSTFRLPACQQIGYLKNAVVQTYVEGLIAQIVAAAPLDFFHFEQADRVESELAQLERQIDRLEHQIEAMIVNQADAPGATRHLYDKQIARAAEQLETLTERRTRLLTEGTRQSHSLEMQRITYETIKERGAGWFWNLSDREINQTLHRLFGPYRLVALDKQIVGIVDPRQHGSVGK